MEDNIFTNGIKVNNKNLKAEANIVKDLIIKLNDNNITTSIEYKIKKSRVDIVVIKDNLVKCCIEVKKNTRKEFNTNTRQYKRYTQIGLPTIYCLGSKNINKTVEIVKDKMLKDTVKVEMIVLN